MAKRSLEDGAVAGVAKDRVPPMRLRPTPFDEARNAALGMDETAFLMVQSKLFVGNG